MNLNKNTAIGNRNLEAVLAYSAASGLTLTFPKYSWDLNIVYGAYFILVDRNIKTSDCTKNVWNIISQRLNREAERKVWIDQCWQLNRKLENVWWLSNVMEGVKGCFVSRFQRYKCFLFITSTNAINCLVVVLKRWLDSLCNRHKFGYTFSPNRIIIWLPWNVKYYEKDNWIIYNYNI